jgi:hypothetical protein
VFSESAAVDRHCTRCETPFDFAGVGWAAKYCCKECARQADLERRRNAYRPQRPSDEYHDAHVCNHCDEEFLPGRWGALYCSTRCRVAAHRARQTSRD